MKELSTISTAPPEKEKPARIGRATVIAAVTPANKACTTYRPGARNMKENSIGSVTPVKKEQNAADANNPYTIFFLPGFAVLYIARQAAGRPNIMNGKNPVIYIPVCP